MNTTKDVPDDYFRTGIFAGAAPGELLQHYTCSGCGTRLKTWQSFVTHRRTHRCAVTTAWSAPDPPPWKRPRPTTRAARAA